MAETGRVVLEELWEQFLALGHLVPTGACLARREGAAVVAEGVLGTPLRNNSIALVLLHLVSLVSTAICFSK